MIKLNSDLRDLAIVKSRTARFVPSPLPGVERMMLERIGDEKVTRATSVVRYEPGASFSAHVHDGGEEFLVLEGTFSDATGNFSKGFYVRNPVGSSHAPWSTNGTRIFVKLGQTNPTDKTWVRLDTSGADWHRHANPGLRTLVLHSFGSECTRLIELKPGTHFPENTFPRGAEIFVISGCLEIAGSSLKSGDWMRSPAGTTQSISSKRGVTFYLKTGHLGTTSI